MVVKSIKVVDYSSGSAYRYTDKTGSWQSIQAVGGKVMAGAQKGKGNAGKLAVSTPAAGSSDTTGPHKVGLIIPTTSGAFDGELSKGKNFNKGADSSESDQSPTSSGSSLSGSGSADSGKYGSASTGELTGAGSKLFAFEGIVFGAMVLVIGWIL